MNNIKLQFKKALELIKKSDNILLTTHEGTDGDDLGSLLGMIRFLKQLGKKYKVVIKGGVPEKYHYLPDHEIVKVQLPASPSSASLGGPDVSDFDLLVTFGARDMNRIGFKELLQFQAPILNFDHHPDNTNFGTVNVVDSNTSAVAELVYHFLKFADAIIDKEIATCLLSGIFYDTGGFKHANTTAEALQVSAELLKRGARIDKIAFQLMGKKTPAAIRAWAKGLENARFDPEKKMVFSVLTEADLKEIGAIDEDLDGFVELLNNLPQSKFALLLRQDGDIVKGSLRSEPQKKIDVSKIAQMFGGGGHKLSSGFKIKGKLIREGDAWQIK